MKFKTILITVALATFSLFCAAAPAIKSPPTPKIPDYLAYKPMITMPGADQIQAGMHGSDVRRILGEGGTHIANDMIAWDIPKESWAPSRAPKGLTVLNQRFVVQLSRNLIVQSIHQEELFENTGDYRLKIGMREFYTHPFLSALDKADIGMFPTRDQVLSILGKPTSVPRPEVDSYKADQFSYITFTYDPSNSKLLMIKELNHQGTDRPLVLKADTSVRIHAKLTYLPREIHPNTAKSMCENRRMEQYRKELQEVNSLILTPWDTNQISSPMRIAESFAARDRQVEFKLYSTEFKLAFCAEHKSN